MKIVTVVGARPQFVKAAVLSREFSSQDGMEEVLIHTGQHFDKNMSEIFFNDLEIPRPKYFLNINGSSHGKMTGHMLSEIEEILLKEQPDKVLVYGDTNSTLAGALAAAKLHIPVVHVEAGLRSYNKKMPEEINRVMTDHVSQFLLCPTISSVENLQKEGIVSGVYHVGDVMYDATIFAVEKNNKDATLSKKLGFIPEKFIFMTVHRADSTESKENFDKIMKFVHHFSSKSGMKIVFPVHPRTKTLVERCEFITEDHFVITEPLGYFETQFCLSKASYVLTDSGGLQKEAYFHKVPCVTLRSETEWVETIDKGWNRLWTVIDYKPRKEIKEYGDGNSAKSICKILLKS